MSEIIDMKKEYKEGDSVEVIWGGIRIPAKYIRRSANGSHEVMVNKKYIPEIQEIEDPEYD